MSRELVTLTTHANMTVLAYLLDLVREEAAQSRRPAPSAESPRLAAS